MIKTKDRAPKIYSEQSRDFQLFGHLFDAAFNASKTPIDTMINNQGTENLDYRFVDLMCKTIGFDYHGSYTSNELIYVIKSFKKLLQNKGSRKSIESAINTLISSQGIKESFFINESDWDSEDKNLNIYLPDGTQNSTLLEELFEYILPSGWTYSIIIKSFGKSSDTFVNDIALVNRIRYKDVNETVLAKANYVKNGSVVNPKNIGQVPDNVNDEIISPVVNLGTVLTDEDQTSKYDN